MGLSDAQILASLTIPVQATGVQETYALVDSLKSPLAGASSAVFELGRSFDTLEVAEKKVYDLGSAFDALQAKESAFIQESAKNAQTFPIRPVIEETTASVHALADSYDVLSSKSEQVVYSLAEAWDVLRQKEEHYAKASASNAQASPIQPVIAATAASVHELADSYEVLGAAERTVYEMASAYDVLQAKEEHYSQQAARNTRMVEVAVEDVNSSVYELAGSYGILEAAEASEAAAANTSASAKGVQAKLTEDERLAAERSIKTKNEQVVAERNQGRAANEAAAAARTRSTQLTMGMMALSNAVQDVQYGFGAIVNNIPMMAMGLGGIMGWTTKMTTAVGAFAQIAGVIVNIAIPHVKSLAESWGLVKTAAEEAMEAAFGEVERLEARIKSLKDKPIKLYVDAVELRNAENHLKDLKADIQAFEDMRNLRSKHQKEAGTQFESAFAETGKSREIVDEIKKKMQAAFIKKAKDEAQAWIDQESQQWHDEVEAIKNGDAMDETKMTDIQVAGARHFSRLAAITKERDKKIAEAEDLAPQVAGDVFDHAKKGWDAHANEAIANTLEGLTVPGVDRKTLDKLAEEVRDATAEKVQTKAEKKKKKDEQDELETDTARTFRDKVHNIMADKENMEPWTKGLMEARKAGGMTIDGQFQKMNHAQIQENFKAQVMAAWMSALNEQQRQYKKVIDEARTLADGYVKQMASLGKELENQAAHQAKEELAPTLMATIAGGDTKGTIKANIQKQIAAGKEPKAAIEDATKAATEDLAKSLDISTPAGLEQVAHAVTPLGKQAFGEIKGEEVAAKRKADNKEDRKDEKSEEKAFQASIENTGIGDFAEAKLAQWRAEAEWRKANGLKAPSDEQIVQGVQNLVGDRIHHRYTGEVDSRGREIPVRRNGKAVDFNPGMDKEKTTSTAAEIVTRAERNLNEHMAELSGRPLNTIEKFMTIQGGLIQKVQSLNLRFDNLDANASMQAAQVRKIKPGRRGMANWGGN